MLFPAWVPTSPVQGLLNALGTANVPAIYDGLTSSSITIATGVSNWADARGASGFAPALAQATTTLQPTYTAATGAVAFNGTFVIYTATTGNALFNLANPYSIACVFASAATTANEAICCVARPALAASMILQAGASTPFDFTNKVDSAVSAISTVAPSTNVRLAICSFGGGNANIDIPNKTRVSAAATNPGSTNTFYLTLGGYNITAGAVCTIYAVVCISRVVTAADIMALLAYGSQYGVQTA